MSFFSSLSKRSLVEAFLTKNAPVYVQFYITARCNLTCEQCNIIYANSDVREIDLDGINRIADNLAELRVAMVLLTGGEPFMRTDLPGIIGAFESRGIHVRMQTNGLANEESIQRAVEAGGRDISISLDTLNSELQDRINGQFVGSWEKALRAMTLFSKHLPEKSFASLGCVLQSANIRDVPEVVEFGTKIGWFTSLVPVHVTRQSQPLGFRTYDRSLRFRSDEIPVVHSVIEKVRSMRRSGYLLYDSDQYLDDMKRFVSGEPIEWRDRNGAVCDSPNLYFAILPNGDFAPCCDYRLGPAVSTADPSFPKVYRSAEFRRSVLPIVKSCSGCMYGSYPEITITFRYLRASFQRLRVFATDPPKKPWPLEFSSVLDLAAQIKSLNAKCEAPNA